MLEAMAPAAAMMPGHRGECLEHGDERRRPDAVHGDLRAARRGEPDTTRELGRARHEPCRCLLDHDLHGTGGQTPPRTPCRRSPRTHREHALRERPGIHRATQRTQIRPATGCRIGDRRDPERGELATRARQTTLELSGRERPDGDADDILSPGDQPRGHSGRARRLGRQAGKPTLGEHGGMPAPVPEPHRVPRGDPFELRCAGQPPEQRLVKTLSANPHARGEPGGVRADGVQ